MGFVLVVRSGAYPRDGCPLFGEGSGSSRDRPGLAIPGLWETLDQGATLTQRLHVSDARTSCPCVSLPNVLNVYHPAWEYVSGS